MSPSIYWFKIGYRKKNEIFLSIFPENGELDTK